eukprot:3408570-Prymnesium_polylepis.1
MKATPCALRSGKKPSCRKTSPWPGKVRRRRSRFHRFSGIVAEGPHLAARATQMASCASLALSAASTPHSRSGSSAPVNVSGGGGSRGVGFERNSSSAWIVACRCKTGLAGCKISWYWQARSTQRASVPAPCDLARNASSVKWGSLRRGPTAATLAGGMWSLSKRWVSLAAKSARAISLSVPFQDRSSCDRSAPWGASM